MDRVYLHGENGDASQFGVSRDLSQHLILLSNYKVEDVYNMDGTLFFNRAQPNKTITQGKVKDRKI
jgi:hypothetical protein